MNALKKEEIYMIDDIYALPEGERAELLDREIYYIAPPSSKQMDFYKKLFKYRTARVKEYWVVDPERELVTIYNFEKDSMEVYSFD